MKGILAASTITWVVIGIVAVIVFCIVMHFINREFRIRYRLNLFGGGLLMLLAGGGFALGALGLNGTLSKPIGFLGFGIAIILILITLIYDCKKCGGMGIVAFLCQIVFAPCSLFLIFELFSSHGRSMTYGDYADRRDIQRARERRGYTDKNGNNGKYF